MTDNVTNELMFETMKQIQAKLAEILSEIHDIKADNRALRTHMAGFMQSEVATSSTVAGLQVRIERIERRLNLNDA